MGALEITGLRKEFGGVVALAGVDITIPEGDVVGIVGPNGSGKTTLFNTITGVHKPTRGSVRWQDRDITGWRAHRIARAGIAHTFQHAMAFPGLTVAENVQIACEHHGPHANGERSFPWPKPEDLLAFTGLIGLADEVAGPLPFGSLRLLGFAMALGARPSLLLLDEPAAGLNDRETAAFADLVRQLPGAGISVCVIDHDMNLMKTLCRRLIVLDFGSKIADGPTAEVLADPKVLEVYLGAQL